MDAVGFTAASVPNGTSEGNVERVMSYLDGGSYGLWFDILP